MFEYSKNWENQILIEIEETRMLENLDTAEHNLKCRKQFKRFLNSDNKLSDIIEKSDLK